MQQKERQQLGASRRWFGGVNLVGLLVAFLGVFFLLLHFGGRYFLQDRVLRQFLLHQCFEFQCLRLQ